MNYKHNRDSRHILQILDPQHIVQIVDVRQRLHFAARPFRQILEQRPVLRQQLSVLGRVLEALQLVIESGARSFGGQNLVHLFGQRMHGNGLPRHGCVPDIVAGRRPHAGQIGFGAHQGAIDVGGLNVETILVVVGADQIAVASAKPFAEFVVLQLADLCKESRIDYSSAINHTKTLYYYIKKTHTTEECLLLYA